MSKFSPKEIDDLIADIAETHPNYTMEQFIADFKSTTDRDPTFAEKRDFQKAVKNLPPQHALQQKFAAAPSQTTASDTSSSSTSSSRSTEIAVSFRNNPKGGVIIKKSECTFTKTKQYIVFMRDAITEEAIFRWTVRIDHGDGRKTTFGFVASSPEDLEKNDDEAIALLYSGKACSLELNMRYDDSCCFKSKEASFCACLWGTEEISITSLETPVHDGSLIAVEVDGNEGTLSYFVNDEKIPVAISGVRLPLHLGISGMAKQSFTSVSFSRLPSATPSPVTCKFFKKQEPRPVTKCQFNPVTHKLELVEE